ncbi:hypothetical protein FJTKL_07396 [Diaporthe vaccinii]|uniref:HNH nuclease domain-containing protein n=1 Tax=Diaporthe vaccinii TaxID=105482 RepID=A0ABR4ETZ3_9PEZI
MKRHRIGSPSSAPDPKKRALDTSKQQTPPSLLLEAKNGQRISLRQLQRLDKAYSTFDWYRTIEPSSECLKLAESRNCIADDPSDVLKFHFASVLGDDLRSKDRKVRRKHRAGQVRQGLRRRSVSSNSIDTLASEEKTDADAGSDDNTDDENEGYPQTLSITHSLDSWYDPKDNTSLDDRTEPSPADADYDEDDDKHGDENDDVCMRSNNYDDDAEDGGDCCMAGCGSVSEERVKKDRSGVYYAQQKLLINTFFSAHPDLTAEQCHEHVSDMAKTDSLVLPAGVQSPRCYTCRIDSDEKQTMTLFQFLDDNLEQSQLVEARKRFGDVVPVFRYHGKFQSLFVWILECPVGLPFGSVIDELLENELSTVNNLKQYKDIVVDLSK